MASVNFSVPDEVKAAFDRAFRGRNKSAIIAEFMRRAVAERKQQKRRENMFRVLTQRRSQRSSATDTQIRAARKAGRP